MEKSRSHAIQPWFGCMVRRSLSNMRRLHLLSTRFAINLIKSTSRMYQRQSASRPPIARHKAGFGNWMTLCGTSPNASLTMLPENDDENSPRLFNPHFSKSARNVGETQKPIRESFSGYLSVSLHGSVKDPWRGFATTTIYTRVSADDLARMMGTSESL